MTALELPSLSGFGSEVDGAQRIPLQGRHVLWHVMRGVLDVFAVDTGRGGRWQFVGTAEAGAILSAPVRGPKHVLIGRPRAGTVIRAIPIKELMAAQRETWRGDNGLSPQERELARGIDAGLRMLLDFTRDGLPPRDFVPLHSGAEVELTAGQKARPGRGVLWVRVERGRISSGGTTTGFRERQAGDSVTMSELDWISCDTYASLRVRDTESLIADGELWRNLLDLQTRVLYTIDRAVERQNRLESERMAAARTAGLEVRDRADRAMRDVLLSSGGPRAALPGDDDPTVAACELAAAELGITVVAPEVNHTNSKVGPVERVALRSRFRTRTITLRGDWWRVNVGPLIGFLADGHVPVALLWRRGRYHVVDPRTRARTAMSAVRADELERRAVMLYRPLPEKPVRSWQLLLFGLRGSGPDVRTLVLGTVVAVLLGLLVPIATGQVLGEYVPSANSEPDLAAVRRARGREPGVRRVRAAAEPGSAAGRRPFRGHVAGRRVGPAAAAAREVLHPLLDR